ncbi:MAG TPA: ABC transporter permease subunit [Blastococcus sp.]|jgi:ABC-2 type transport system permease protein
MSDLRVVAGKELVDVRRSRFLVLLVGFLVVAVTLSTIVEAAAFRVSLADYAAYVEALRRSGSSVTPPAPQLFPLQLLRGGIEYVELVGALFAVVLGYGMVAKERQRGTTELIFSRPVGRYAVAGGKILALAVSWLVAVGVLFLVVIGVMLVVGGASLHLVDLERLALTAAASWLYLLLWSCLAMALAALGRRPITGLLAPLVVWLGVVLLVPQIGDTMDPDNQVPGGLFASLQIAKPDERAVLAHFAVYDAVRNGLEVSSVTKHFERASFAYLGVKDAYNQKPVGLVWSATLVNFLVLILTTTVTVLLAAGTTTRRAILRRNS